MCQKEVKRLDKVGHHSEQIAKVIKLLLKSNNGETQCQEAVSLIKASKPMQGTYNHDLNFADKSVVSNS